METTGGSTNHKRFRGGGNAADVRTDGELVPQAALSVVVVPGRTSLRMKNSAKKEAAFLESFLWVRCSSVIK